jgi:hypothetical protein
MFNYIFSLFSLTIPLYKLAHNVQAVNDVFYFCDKGNCEAVSRKHKTVAEQNGTKGRSPDWRFV